MAEQYTSLLSDKNGEIQCLIWDSLSLFNDDIELVFSQIINKDSWEKFKRFLSVVEKNHTEMNWEINIDTDNLPETLFFSGMAWDQRAYLIKITYKRMEALFIKPDEEEFAREDFDVSQNEEPGFHEFDKISRLNNELVDLQRKLARKNVELESINEKLEELATTDPLTGLYNRRAIFKRAETEFERGVREGRDFGLAMLDLDDFKGINDSYGHPTGDKALKQVSESIEKSLREYDKAGRIGGDEFLIFFSVDSRKDLKSILKRMFENVTKDELILPGNDKSSLTVSIGAVYFEKEDKEGFNIEDLVRKADDALYRAKERGGGQIELDNIE